MIFMRFSVFCFLLFAFHLGLMAQDHSTYPYVIVPDQFEFQKEKDQYQLSSLIQFLLNKQGFKAYLDSQKTKELLKSPCQSLNFVLKRHRHFLRTKLQFQLVNCERDTLFKSEIGESFLKDYKKAYHESIRLAFESYTDSIYQINLKNYNRLKGLSDIEPQQENSVSNVNRVNDSNKTLNASQIDNNSQSLSLAKRYANKAGLQVVVTSVDEGFKGIVTNDKFGYKKGKVLFELQATSVPNIYKALWFDPYGNTSNTVASLSNSNEIHIDLMTANGIVIQVFKAVQ